MQIYTKMRWRWHLSSEWTQTCPCRGGLILAFKRPRLEDCHKFMATLGYWVTLSKKANKNQKNNQTNNKKKAKWSWGGDSVVKSQCCSCREPAFSSQHPRPWQVIITPDSSSGGPSASSDLSKPPGRCVMCMPTRNQNAHSHNKIKFTNSIEKRNIMTCQTPEIWRSWWYTLGIHPLQRQKQESHKFKTYERIACLKKQNEIIII